MTLEEKIAHLQTSSMEQARAEGNAIIDSHREALEKDIKYRPDPSAPDMTRNEKIMSVLYAISL